MPALVAGIHALRRTMEHKVVDGRDKPGHDGQYQPFFSTFAALSLSYHQVSGMPLK